MNLTKTLTSEKVYGHTVADVEASARDTSQISAMNSSMNSTCRFFRCCDSAVLQSVSSARILGDIPGCIFLTPGPKLSLATVEEHRSDMC